MLIPAYFLFKPHKIITDLSKTSRVVKNKTPAKKCLHASAVHIFVTSVLLICVQKTISMQPQLKKFSTAVASVTF